jgi:hypothetical protein
MRAWLDHPNPRDRRRAERATLLDVMEESGLIVRTRGDQPRWPKKTGDNFVVTMLLTPPGQLAKETSEGWRTQQGEPQNRGSDFTLRNELAGTSVRVEVPATVKITPGPSAEYTVIMRPRNDQRQPPEELESRS